MAAGMSTPASVAVIIPTVRPGRNGPKVAKLVIETIQKALPKGVTLKIIDLAEWKLPVFEGAEVPFTITNSELYSSDISRRWSREISGHQGYIFLVPEYNGSYAGSLKNAVDYLYNEWSKKAAMIVNYGAQPAEALKGGNHFTGVLSQLQMKVPSVLPKVSVSTLDREKTAAGEDLVFYKEEIKSQVQDEIALAWQSMLRSLQLSSVSPASA
ncbi:hypothetical protein DRE_01307 [Drechslerella stenobrocha 248]|uniref:NADPH-dependent FMN reductase-like domain-containing protein n=1 Tax=Drechslerella stenobrocha 248 TaxID=1043628 RepID=W7I5E3_9PEZI|nr:hypothetical protein DRE_01307 [Drechslerella stenobrocha 248]